jgi:hypothetical protein
VQAMGLQRKEVRAPSPDLSRKKRSREGESVHVGAPSEGLLCL